MRLKLVSFILALVPSLVLSGQPEVTTANGVVRGTTVTAPNGKEVYVFYGIPFAKPPVGDLRFRKPVPATPWETPIEATKPPNACSQTSITAFQDFEGEKVWNPNTEVSEDCLYLNVYVPVSKFQQKTNVFFWIYGGGFFSGSSSLDVYNGATLASEQDVIVVSSQYRLATFGFLYFGTENAPGNMGLLDQNLALKWASDNIAAFGGDPAEITLFGESAGSASVSYHLLSPLSQDLFKRAVMLSGQSTSSWVFRSPEDAIRVSNQIAASAGCLPADRNGTKSPSEIVECLREVDVEKLLSTQWNHVKHLMEFPCTPTVDGYFLRDEPKNLLQKWDTKRTELIVGNVADEGTYFVVYRFLKYFNYLKMTSVSYDAFLTIMRDVFQAWPEEEREAIIFHYTNWENVEDGVVNHRRISEAIGDAHFNCPLRDFADKWSGRGLKVYYYLFTQHAESDPWAKWMGVKHGDEIRFFLGQTLNSSSEYSPEEQNLSRKIMDLLGNFAKTGKPAATWESYTRDYPHYLNLNATLISDVTSPTEYGPRAESCAFWNIYLPKLRQQLAHKKKADGEKSPATFTCTVSAS